MNFLKNPYVKWGVIAFLFLVIVYDVSLFLKRKEVSSNTLHETENFYKPMKFKEQTQPIYKIAKIIRDPFKGEDSKLWRLQESLKIEQMELELLKTKLEKTKIANQIATTKGQVKIGGGTEPVLKAILWANRGKTALFEYKGKEITVREGDVLGNYIVSRIERKGVFLSNKGKMKFYPVHPPY